MSHRSLAGRGKKKMSCIQTFSIGGGELLFLIGLIGSSLIYTSVPSLVYLIFGIIFFNQIFNYEDKLITQKIKWCYTLLVYSCSVLVIKIIVSILIALDVMPYSAIALKTFGVPIKPNNYSAELWLPTLFPELGALFCEVFLLVIHNELRHYSQS